MKFNRNLYLELMFYIIGTAITVIIFTIVGINFAKDARFFGNTLTVVEEGPKEQDDNNVVVDGGGISETIYFNRKPASQQNNKAEPDTKTEMPVQTEAPKPSATTAKNATPSTNKPTGTVATNPINNTQGNGNTGGNTDPILKIEIANYSGVDSLAFEMRQKLQEAGYFVVIREEETTTTVGTTAIIDRSEENLGEEIRGIIKSGRVERAQGNSPYAVTIIIGLDLLP